MLAVQGNCKTQCEEHVRKTSLSFDSLYRSKKCGWKVGRFPAFDTTVAEQ